MNKLDTTERHDLAKLKKVVADGEKQFLAVGNALLEIRDRKLYREESLTFEAFCQKAWGWSRSHAYRFIGAAEVCKMSPMGDTIPNERAARELAKVPEVKRAEVMKVATSNGSVPTAKAITKAATQVTAPVTIELDDTGIPVPQKAMMIWKRRDDVQSLLSQLTAIRSALKTAQDAKDMLFTEVNFSAVMGHLENAYGGIKRAKPYAVCFKCQGKLVDTCTVCGGRGVTSKHLYDCCDEKVRAMRIKGAKK